MKAENTLGPVAGIIAEFNVFHLGHELFLRAVRERLGENSLLVVCMSGNFVQRGDFAILEKHCRAETALLGGADLVLELPTPWAAAGAERFAQGGVAALDASGVVTHLVFGCECGDLSVLQRAADCLENPDYSGLLRRCLSYGMTFAAARESALRELAGTAADCLSRPNDALAVEYLRALKASNSAMIPLALPRVGVAHDSGDMSGVLSAGKIRARLLDRESWGEFVPPYTEEILKHEITAGRAPVSIRYCERAVLARLRSMREEDFAPYDGGGEGLYHRFYASVRESCSVEEILSKTKTKRYPLARLRRMLLHCYLDVPEAVQGQTPPYLRVLGANAKGRMLLRRMASAAALPVITKPAHGKMLSGFAGKTFACEAACTDLYGLARPTPGMPGGEFRRGPVIL